MSRWFAIDNKRIVMNQSCQPCGSAPMQQDQPQVPCINFMESASQMHRASLRIGQETEPEWNRLLSSFEFDSIYGVNPVRKARFCTTKSLEPMCFATSSAAAFPNQSSVLSKVRKMSRIPGRIEYSQ